ncbi:hypothetical protein WJX73_010235 [Symbiochloris irregularis]|uniref:Uncharacterized protein n=1 Tax=Symbiochloris irregularis TaxID=706552 RepID=A0AAW1PBP6_9CHLO
MKLQAKYRREDEVQADVWVESPTASKGLQVTDPSQQQHLARQLESQTLKSQVALGKQPMCKDEMGTALVDHESLNVEEATVMEQRYALVAHIERHLAKLQRQLQNLTARFRELMGIIREGAMLEVDLVEEQLATQKALLLLDVRRGEHEGLWERFDTDAIAAATAEARERVVSYMNAHFCPTNALLRSTLEAHGLPSSAPPPSTCQPGAICTPDTSTEADPTQCRQSMTPSLGSTVAPSATSGKATINHSSGQAGQCEPKRGDTGSKSGDLAPTDDKGATLDNPVASSAAAAADARALVCLLPRDAAKVKDNLSSDIRTAPPCKAGEVVPGPGSTRALGKPAASTPRPSVLVANMAANSFETGETVAAEITALQPHVSHCMKSSDQGKPSTGADRRWLVLPGSKPGGKRAAPDTGSEKRSETLTLADAPALDEETREACAAAAGEAYPCSPLAAGMWRLQPDMPATVPSPEADKGPRVSTSSAAAARTPVQPSCGLKKAEAEPFAPLGAGPDMGMGLAEDEEEDYLARAREEAAENMAWLEDMVLDSMHDKHRHPSALSCSSRLPAPPRDSYPATSEALMPQRVSRLQPGLGAFSSDMRPMGQPPLLASGIGSTSTHNTASACGTVSSSGEGIKLQSAAACGMPAAKKPSRSVLRSSTNMRGAGEAPAGMELLHAPIPASPDRIPAKVAARAVPQSRRSLEHKRAVSQSSLPSSILLADTVAPGKPCMEAAEAHQWLDDVLFGDPGNCAPSTTTVLLGTGGPSGPHYGLDADVSNYCSAETSPIHPAALEKSRGFTGNTTHMAPGTPRPNSSSSSSSSRKDGFTSAAQSARAAAASGSQCTAPPTGR